MQVIENNDLDADIIDWPVYMQRALQLAQQVLTTTPNPRVGCLLVKNGKVVGEGWHVAAGQDHAEVMAIRDADAHAISSTAIVTLEPCAHTGRTGPCAEALIDAGVSQVVIAALDPNPEVAGQGVAKLEAAGIDVVHLKDMEKPSRSINPGYFKRRETGLPYVRCKLAMSLDGRTALANGESKWITGERARADVQLLRAYSSAVITGIETILKDDPSMNVRVNELVLAEEFLNNNIQTLARQPLRIILDSELRTPKTARTIQCEGDVKIYIAADNDRTNDHEDNVEIKKVEALEKGVNLRSVLESLASDFECNEVLVEAGSTLSTAFIEAGLVDELIVYIAPKLFGSDGKPLVDLVGLKSVSDSIQFEIADVVLIKGDVRLTLIPEQSADD